MNSGPKSDPTAPRVLNRHHGEPPEGSVYIGRGQKWGNPFRLGVDGDRAKVIGLYAEWLANETGLLASLGELTGRHLVCYCAPARCHGDILLRLANPDPTEVHRHRCEVRQVLRWRVEHGSPWVRRWLDGYVDQGTGRQVKGVRQQRGTLAASRLLADCIAQWNLGNRGADGDWRAAPS